MTESISKNFSFGPFASIASYINVISPIPLFLEILKLGNIEKLPNYTYGSNAIMQFGWVVYGYKISDSNIFYVSLISGIMMTIYSFISFFWKKQFQRISFLMIIIGIQLAILFRLSSSILGIINCLVQICSSLTNLELIFKAINQKNGSFFNPTSLLMCIPSGFLWTLYGFEVSNIYIILPSFLDFTLFVIQALIYIAYPKKEKITKIN